MPRYVVERTFPDGLTVPINGQGAESARGIASVNREEGVHWLHSYVSLDKRTTYCVYDAAGPEAIQRAAQRNGLPVDRITEVRVLDAHFYY
jgi:hypothetical protein